MVDYRLLEKTIKDSSKNEKQYLPVLSNTVSSIMDHIPGINWVGFYLKDEDGLYLGPFQGKSVTVTRLPEGKGLCASAMKKNDMVYVPDVNSFPDYVCDDASTDCALVFPLHANNMVIGVLLICSPILNRFSVSDRDNLRRLVTLLEKNTDFSQIAGSMPAATTKQPAKNHNMPFELWLYAIKGLAQTYEMVEPIYSQLSDQEKKALQEEYEKL